MVPVSPGVGRHKDIKMGKWLSRQKGRPVAAGPSRASWPWLIKQTHGSTALLLRLRHGPWAWLGHSWHPQQTGELPCPLPRKEYRTKTALKLNRQCCCGGRGKANKGMTRSPGPPHTGYSPGGWPSSVQDWAGRSKSCWNWSCSVTAAAICLGLAPDGVWAWADWNTNTQTNTLQI